MTKFQLKKIMQAYEKGNVFPFIKAAKKGMSYLEYTLGSCDRELKRWWASKMVEFLRLRWSFAPFECRPASVMRYIVYNLPWCAMTSVKYRLPDEFLNEACKDEKAYSWMYEHLGWLEFSTYTHQICSDNELIKKMIKDYETEKAEVSKKSHS